MCLIFLCLVFGRVFQMVWNGLVLAYMVQPMMGFGMSFEMNLVLFVNSGVFPGVFSVILIWSASLVNDWVILG